MEKYNINIDTLDFKLEVKYKEDCPNPERIFQALTEIVQCIEQFDFDYARVLDPDVRSSLILKNIKEGSIILWLYDEIRSIDDQDIMDLNYKRIIGKKLVRFKYIFLKWLEGKIGIKDIRDVEILRDSLREEAESLSSEAEQEGVVKLMSNEPPSASIILSHCEQISRVTSYLCNEDEMTISFGKYHSKINNSFKISKEEICNLLASKRKTIEQEVILKVKKPDYLGQSKWDFFFKDHTLPVKINDEKWLKRFKNREVDLKPGDALRGLASITGVFDKDGNQIDAGYSFNEIIEVIPSTKDDMLLFPFE